MANLSRYKFTFGKKTMTNRFLIICLVEEVEKVSTEKYQAIKERMLADDETLAILLAINSLSTQLNREIEFDDRKERN